MSDVFPDPEMRLLFACGACARDQCWDCVHFADEFCVHRCFWLYRQGDNDDQPSG